MLHSMASETGVFWGAGCGYDETLEGILCAGS